VKSFNFAGINFRGQYVFKVFAQTPTHK